MGSRDRWAEELQLNESCLRVLVTFLAAGHDIGKANPFFQAKSNSHEARLRHWGLHTSTEPAGHGQASAALLIEWLCERWGWQLKPAAVIGTVVGGHHGIFNHDWKLSTLGVQEDPWHRASFDLLDTLSEVIGAQEWGLLPD
jgi:CRISPR-associated endonuclease Cas3-HD